MIISPETLLDEGDELNHRAALKARLKQIERQPDGQIFHLDSEEWFQEDGEGEGGAEYAPGTMKCLQIDLQKFGLGTSRFAFLMSHVYPYVDVLPLCLCCSLRAPSNSNAYSFLFLLKRETRPREQVLAGARRERDQSYVQLDVQNGQLTGESIESRKS